MAISGSGNGSNSPRATQLGSILPASADRPTHPSEPSPARDDSLDTSAARPAPERLGASQAGLRSPSPGKLTTGSAPRTADPLDAARTAVESGDDAAALGHTIAALRLFCDINDAASLPETVAIVRHLEARGQPAYRAMDELKSELVERLAQPGGSATPESVCHLLAALHGKADYHRELSEAFATVFAPEQLSKTTPDVPTPEEFERLRRAAFLRILGEAAIPMSLMLATRGQPGPSAPQLAAIPTHAAATLTSYFGDASADGEIPKFITGEHRLSPWMHALMDISAMRGARAYRITDANPSGRLPWDQVCKGLRDNNARPGRDAAITERVISLLPTDALTLR